MRRPKSGSSCIRPIGGIGNETSAPVKTGTPGSDARPLRSLTCRGAARFGRRPEGPDSWSTSLRSSYGTADAREPDWHAIAVRPLTRRCARTPVASIPRTDAGGSGESIVLDHRARTAWPSLSRIRPAIWPDFGCKPRCRWPRGDSTQNSSCDADQIENQRFGIEAVLSSNREEGWSIRNEIVAGTAGHDVTGRTPLLGQPSAALDIGGLRLPGYKKKRETRGNAIHEPPPNFWRAPQPRRGAACSH